MRVLDLFAGLGGWSQAFRDRGHDVLRLEIERRFNPDITADILTWDPLTLPWTPDLVLASPPCTSFTMMTVGRNWTHAPENAPKTESARMGLRMLERAITVIDLLAPRWFLIENPRAKMRTMACLAHMERRTVTYCQYGETRMKPTDLWSIRWPPVVLKPPCRNGDKCHTRAPRGSRTGTQGMNPAQSAKIPYELSLAVCLACETAHD